MKEFITSLLGMSKAALVDLLTQKSLLIDKVSTELGDSGDGNLIKSLNGTPEEKAKQFTTLNDEAEAIEAELNNRKSREETQKKNAERLAVMGGSTVAKNANDTTVKTENKDSIYQKAFKIPAKARIQHSKVCKNDEEAYALGMWFISTYGAKTNSGDTRKALEWVGEHLNMKALSEGTNEAGGALVPYEFIPQLIDIKDQYGVYGRNMNKVPMNRDVAKIPRVLTHNSAYWDTESGTVTESAPAFNTIDLVAKKLSAWLAIPMELIEDSAIALGDWIMQDMAWKFAQAEDEAAFIGNGTGTYGNVTGFSSSLLNLSGTIANIAGVTVAAGNLFSEVVMNDLMSFIGSLHTMAVPRGKIYCSNRVFWGVFNRLTYAQGGVTALETVAGVTRYLFQGIPVEMTQAMPSADANSQIMALYGDVNLSSKMGDRRSFNIATSDQVYFLKDQLVIRANERLDINVHDVGNASATASLRVAGPMVGLISAAA